MSTGSRTVTVYRPHVPRPVAPEARATMSSLMGSIMSAPQPGKSCAPVDGAVRVPGLLARDEQAGYVAAGGPGGQGREKRHHVEGGAVGGRRQPLDAAVRLGFQRDCDGPGLDMPCRAA